MKAFIETLKPAPGTSVKYDAIFEVPPARFMGELPADSKKLIRLLDASIEKYKDEEPMYSLWD